MIILILLVIVWTPYLVTALVRARHAHTHLPAAHAEPPTGAQTGAGYQGESAWSVLDDRQLTRLLTDSAPQTTTE